MILRKTLRDNAWKSLVFAVLLTAHLVAVVVFFPDFERLAQSIKGKIPGEFFKKLVDDQLSQGYNSYIAFQHFAKAIATFGTFAAVFLANGAVAGEVHEKTAEFLLSRPMSRTKILATKYLTGAFLLVLPVFLVSPLAIPLADYIDEKVSAGSIVIETIHSSLFLILLYSITFLVSTLMRNDMVVAFLMLGIYLAEFVLLIIPVAARYSIFKLADMDAFMEILRGRNYPYALQGIMAGLSAALFFASLVCFRRRDF